MDLIHMKGIYPATSEISFRSPANRLLNLLPYLNNLVLNRRLTPSPKLSIYICIMFYDPLTGCIPKKQLNLTDKLCTYYYSFKEQKRKNHHQNQRTNNKDQNYSQKLRNEIK